MLSEEILNQVCRHHNITRAEICEPYTRSTTEITEAKENAAFLLSHFCGLNNEQISRVLGYGTKQRAIVARNSVERIAPVNKAKAQTLNSIISEVTSLKLTIGW